MKQCNDSCPMTCKYLNITEWGQSELKKTTGETIPHWCLKYDTKLYHLSAHPRLFKCEECYQEGETHD